MTPIKPTLFFLLLLLPAYQCFSEVLTNSKNVKLPDVNIVITATTTNASCYKRIQPSGGRLGDGSITATATGGIAPYTYELSSVRPPQDTGYFPRLSSGNYVVIVKDAVGATESLNVYLSDTLPLPLFTFNVLQLPSACTAADGSVQMTTVGGTPPYTYSIDGGVTYSPTNEVVTNLPQGYGYVFFVKDANGCIAAAWNGSSGDANAFMCKSCCYFQITGMIDQLSCNNDGQITAYVNSIAPPIYYSLDGINYQLASNGVNLNVFSNLAAGVYHIYAKNADDLVTEASFTIAKACPTYLEFSKINSGCKQINGSITVTANFGTPPYRYFINGTSNSGNNVFTGLQAGNHNITVIDSLGESESEIVYLRENCPSVLVKAINTNCNKKDGSINATGSNGTAPYFFSIDGINFQSSNIFNDLQSGNYTVTIKDNNGNKDSANTTVAVGNCLQLMATAINPTCGNSNGMITVTVISGTAPYEYSIDGINFMNDNSFPGLPSGNFVVTVKDGNGLIGIANAFLSNEPAPVISLSAVPASCNNTDGSIAVAVVGGMSPYQYSIDNAGVFQGSNIFNRLDSGQYKVIAKDSNGCSDTSFVLLTAFPKPTVSLVNDTALCSGDSLLLTVPSIANHQYLWQDNSMMTTYLVTAPGIYYVSVTNQYNCIKSDTVNIVYRPRPVFSIGDFTTVCSNQSISLKPSPSVQGIYLWNTGSNAASIPVDKAGLYWLSVNNNGCLFKDSVHIEIKAAPFVNLGSDTTLCEGQILLLNAANTNATYLWQDGSSLPTFSVTQSGAFSVKVVLNGCDTKDEILVRYIKKPVLGLIKDTTICVTEKLILDASFPNSTYIWQDGSVQAQYIVTQPGVYKVQVSNTCGITSSVASVNYQNCNCVFFVPKAFTPDNNGRNDGFKPSYRCLFTNYSFKIFNRYGQEVFYTTNSSAAWDGVYKHDPQPLGTYVWMLQYTDRLTGKTVVKRGTVLLIR